MVCRGSQRGCNLTHRTSLAHAPYELDTRGIGEIAVAYRRRAAARARPRRIGVRAADRRLDNPDHRLFTFQRVELSAQRAAEQRTLPHVQRGRAGRPLEREWSIGVRGLGVEPAHDLARHIRRHTKPVATVAVRRFREALVFLRGIVDRDDRRIREKGARSRVTNPHAGARKHDDASLDRARVAKRRIRRRTSKHADRRARCVEHRRVDKVLTSANRATTCKRISRARCEIRHDHNPQPFPMRRITVARAIVFVVAPALLHAQSSTPAAPAAAPPAADLQRAAQAFNASDWSTVRSAYEALAAAYPQHALSRFRVGVAQLQLGDLKNAEINLRRGESLGIPAAQAAYRLGQLFADRGQPDSAIAELHRSADNGMFVPVPALKSDAHLASLLADPRWPAVLDAFDAVVQPCKHDPRFREFDFWVGDWDVRPTGQPANGPAARNTVTLDDGDCVV